MKDRQIRLTSENDEYVSLLWRIAGVDVNDIINAAIDAKRKNDAAMLEDINALTERVKKHLSNEPKTDKIVFDEHGVTLYKDGTAVKPTLAAIETPEQPKVRKKPGRKPKTLKEFVDGTAREVRQAEKMSKDEFVDYFGGKG